MIRLSARMEAVAALCEKGGCGADVGCDHGYVSIYLVQNGIFEKMLAMDLREGPLSAARVHTEEEGLAEKIECRLSDGLSQYHSGEADALICAGMGGELMRRILYEGAEKLQGLRQLILQPQSEVRQLREYLRDTGFVIAAEDIVFEDGKFYPMFRAVPGEWEADPGDEELYLEFGKQTLTGRHPVLKRFLEHRIVTEDTVREQLKEAAVSGSEKAAERLKLQDKEIGLLKRALSYYK